MSKLFRLLSILLFAVLMYIGRSEVGMLPKLLEWYKVKNTNWGEIPVTLSNLWSLAAAPGLPPPALIEKLPDEDTDTWLDRSPVKRLGLGPEIVWALRWKRYNFYVKLAPWHKPLSTFNSLPISHNRGTTSETTRLQSLCSTLGNTSRVTRRLTWRPWGRGQSWSGRRHFLP